jgi:hypothetical protein
MKLTARLRGLLQWPVNLIVALAVTGIIALLILRKFEIGKEIDAEVVKSLPEVLGVTVLGALLSYVVAQADQRKEELRALQDPLKAALIRVTASYNASKRARRNARALGLLPGGADDQRIAVERYDQYMADLNDAQLELETVKDEVADNPEGFLSAEAIAARLRTMEHYLGEIVSEYERERRKAHGQPEIALERLGEFSGFIAKARESDFKENFSRPHRQIRKLINRDIADLAGGRTKPRTSEEVADLLAAAETQGHD